MLHLLLCLLSRISCFIGALQVVLLQLAIIRRTKSNLAGTCNNSLFAHLVAELGMSHAVTLGCTLSPACLNHIHCHYLQVSCVILVDNNCISSYNLCWVDVCQAGFVLNQLHFAILINSVHKVVLGINYLWVHLGNLCITLGTHQLTTVIFPKGQLVTSRDKIALALTNRFTLDNHFQQSVSNALCCTYIQGSLAVLVGHVLQVKPSQTQGISCCIVGR